MFAQRPHLDHPHFPRRSPFASAGPMTALDIFVVLLLGGAAIVGFIRGFAQEFLALAAWVAAIVALKLFHEPVAQALLGTTGTAAGASMTAFALIFLPVYVGMKLFSRAVGGRARRSVLGPLDRIIGGGFGMLKGLIGATLFFLVAHLATDMVYGADAERPDWMASSATYPLLNASSKAVVGWVETARGDGAVDTAS